MKNLDKIIFLTILIPLILFGNAPAIAKQNILTKAFAKKENSRYILELRSEKKDVFVGEPFDVTLLFKEKKVSSMAYAKFFAPDFKGFWKENVTKPIKFTDGYYRVTKVVYTVTAQRVGKLNIKPAIVKVATRDHAEAFAVSKHFSSIWKSYFSNELNIDAKALPSGVNLVGDFTINATADKSEINSTEATNVLVIIEGNGNLEDVKTLKPYIDGVTIFDEKVVVANNKLSQKMAFVADEDFIIPPYSIKYYDPKTKKIKTISTQEIMVKVKANRAKKELTIKRQEKKKSVNTPQQINKNSISYICVLLSLAVGLFFGIIIMVLKPWKFFVKEKTLDIKDQRVLLMKFLPFRSDNEVQKAVDIFEKNIYSNEKTEIDKKVLKEIIKKYDIS
jgi:hypothetical protein